MTDQSAEIARLTALLDVARSALGWFHNYRTPLGDDVESAHMNRGNGASEWMREDDREFRRDLRVALDATALALAQITPGAEGPQDTAPDRLVKP